MITADFGSFDRCRAQLTQAAAQVQGSGWGTPAWEHAYYLQYRNARADFVEAFWHLVNWPDVAGRFDHVRHLSLRDTSARGLDADTWPRG